MGSYLPIFSVEVEHTFFSSDLCPGLDFTPTPKTHALLAKADLLMRNTPNGIRIFYNRHNTEALGLYARNPDEPLRLEFKVFARDRSFKNYADHGDAEDDSILYFDSDGVKSDEAGRFRLHEADYISEIDFEVLNSPRLIDILSPKESLVKPEFIISIRLEDKEIPQLDESSKAPFKNYYLKFQARETIWKYYLLGNLTKKKSYIVDLNNEMEFEDTGPASLPDNRTALTFRSKQKLPLREKSEYRFQLKDKDPNGGKVLIKRLPVASAGQFFKEIVNGKEAIVSEIFINS